MPLISRKEYAELCGDEVLKVNMWIKRRKIWLVEGDKKKIDSENPVNAAFAAERQLFNQAKQLGVVPVAGGGKKKITPQEEVIIVTKTPKTVTKIPKKVTEKATKVVEKHHVKPEKPAKPAEIQQKERVIAEQTVLAKVRMDQDMQKKALEIENLELGKQQKLLSLNKSAGNLLPVDLVKGVLKRHGDTFFKSFEKSIERFVSIISGSDQEAYVKHLAKVKDILSKTIQDAGKQADEEILILVNDYSETLARGQKKI